jgi:hypothetical protein
MRLEARAFSLARSSDTVTCHLQGGSNSVRAGKMAAQVGTDPDGGAGGWFETEVWVETGDAIDLEKQHVEALSEVMQRLPRSVAVLALKVLQLLDQHWTLVDLISGWPQTTRGSQPFSQHSCLLSNLLQVA